MTSQNATEFTSPDGQIERIRQTVNSMQRRMRALDSLLDEQMRMLELDREMFRPSGIIIDSDNLTLLQGASIAAALLAFLSGFVAGYQR